MRRNAQIDAPRVIRATGSILTRPANNISYSVGDSVSDNATPGSVTPNTVTISDLIDAPVLLTRVKLKTNDTGPATANAVFEMYVYRADPTANSGVGGGDNAAFSNKENGFIGRFSGTFIGGTGSFSDAGVAILTPTEGTFFATLPVSGDLTLYWQIKTNTVFNPSGNSTTFTPVFEGIQGRA